MKQFTDEEISNLIEHTQGDLGKLTSIMNKIISETYDGREIVVAVSGYFTVLHKGHIELFKSARRLGTKLVVIVNNAQQQINKKGKLVHDPVDIKDILKEFSCVDEVVISVDKDATVCRTLVKVNPDVFANGGDRNIDNVPEQDTCFKMGCKMVYGIGGEKANSSSELIEKTGM